MDHAKQHATPWSRTGVREFDLAKIQFGEKEEVKLVVVVCSGQSLPGSLSLSLPLFLCFSLSLSLSLCFCPCLRALAHPLAISFVQLNFESCYLSSRHLPPRVIVPAYVH